MPAKKPKRKAGIRAVPIKPRPEEPPDPTLLDMRRFHASVDWTEWWEEFYIAISSSGTPKYKSYRQFAKEKARSPQQRDFIEYLTGPDGLFESIPDSWKKFKPMDWDMRRETGGWYSDKALEQITQTVRNNTNALEAMRAAGNNVTLRSIARFEKLAQQLDKEFRGRFFVDGVGLADNLARSREYLKLHKDILNLQEQAQEMYARCHGINFQTDGFQTLLMGMKLTAQDADPAQNRVGKVMTKIIEMTLNKSANHDVPLPESIETAIVAIEKKSKVN